MRTTAVLVAFRSGPGWDRTSDLPRVKWLAAQGISVSAGQRVAQRSNRTPWSTCSETLALFWPYSSDRRFERQRSERPTATERKHQPGHRRCAAGLPGAKGISLTKAVPQLITICTFTADARADGNAVVPQGGRPDRRIVFEAPLY